jgi:hypothetical protein
MFACQDSACLYWSKITSLHGRPPPPEGRSPTIPASLEHAIYYSFSPSPCFSCLALPGFIS